VRLLDRIRGITPIEDERSNSLNTGLGMDWFQDLFNYDGHAFPLGMTTTMPGSHEEIAHSYAAYVAQGYQGNGVVYACEAIRCRIFSEARFAWQRRESGVAQDMFTDRRLSILERPWPGGTTQDLLQRLLLSADLGGNAYATVNRHGHVRLLRPDWVTIVRGSDIEDPHQDPEGIDAQLLGYIYKPGGRQAEGRSVALLPNEVTHFAPDPDPLAMFRGMSWITPLVREIAGDTQMSMHKNAFMENAATPNLVVRLDASVTPDQFREFKDGMEEEHAGVMNAYRTMYLGGGADVTVVGADFQKLDFKVVQGHGETRIAAAAGIHPVVVGLSEGMQGSSLNAGNYSQARRNVADTTFHPLWRNVAGSLQTIMRPRSGEELVADVRDVPFLRQDEKDAADIQSRRAMTMNALISNGFTPESAKEFIRTSDWNALEHTGLVSVQLQKPGEGNDDVGDPPEDPEPPETTPSTT